MRMRAWKCALMEHCQTTYYMRDPTQGSSLFTSDVWNTAQKACHMSLPESCLSVDLCYTLYAINLHSPSSLFTSSLFTPACDSALFHSLFLSLPHTKHFLSLCFSIFRLAHDPPAALSQTFELYRKCQRERVHAPARWDQLSLWAAGRHRKPAKGNSTASKQRCRSHQALSSCSGNQELDTIIWTCGFTKGCQCFPCVQFFF